MKKESIALGLKKIGLYEPAASSRENIRNLLLSRHIEKELERGEMPLPRAAIIEITNRCNMSCDMCWLSGIARGKGEELAGSEVIKIIDKLPASIREVTITGGEPLLRDDILDICRHIRKKGIEIMLLTNGYFTVKLKELLKEGLLKKVNISLDGTGEIHNQIRGRKDAFLNAIKSMTALREDRGIEAHFLTVINRANLRHLKSLVSYLKKNGFNDSFMEYERRYDRDMLNEAVAGGLIDEKDVSHLTVSGSALPEYSLEELKSTMLELESYALSNSFLIRYLPESFIRETAMWHNGSIARLHKVKCSHFNIARIDASGRLIPCFAIRKDMGSLLADDFGYLWNGERFRNFRAGLLKKNLLPICTTCYLCRSYARKESEAVRV